MDVTGKFGQCLAHNRPHGFGLRDKFLARVNADHHLHISPLGKILDGLRDPFGHRSGEDVASESEAVAQNIRGEHDHGTVIQLEQFASFLRALRRDILPQAFGFAPHARAAAGIFQDRRRARTFHRSSGKVATRIHKIIRILLHDGRILCQPDLFALVVEFVGHGVNIQDNAPRGRQFPFRGSSHWG